MSLQRFCPTPQNQGQQGSCVGWGSAYTARTILQAVATGENPNQIAFSVLVFYTTKLVSKVVKALILIGRWTT